MPGMGLTYYPPRQGEANKSDIEKINDATRLNKQQQELNKQQPPILLQKPTTPNVNIAKTAEALSNIMELYSKNHPKENAKEEPTGGNPNGDLDVDLSNTNPKDGWGRLDGSDMDSGNSIPVAKPKPKAKVKTKTAVQKTTVVDDGKSKEWYENLANSSYANDKKYEADMKAFRKMQADEIAKNGYYTDSQGVKVYAKAMTDKPKKENNNE